MNAVQLPKELLLRIIVTAGRDVRIALGIRPGKLHIPDLMIGGKFCDCARHCGVLSIPLPNGKTYHIQRNIKYHYADNFHYVEEFCILESRFCQLQHLSSTLENI